MILSKRRESGPPGALIKMHIQRPQLELTESWVDPEICVFSTLPSGSAVWDCVTVTGLNYQSGSLQKSVSGSQQEAPGDPIDLSAGGVCY